MEIEAELLNCGFFTTEITENTEQRTEASDGEAEDGTAELLGVWGRHRRGENPGR